MITQLSSLEGAAAAAVDADRGVVWIVEAVTPRLSSWDLADETLILVTELAFAPTGVALSGDRESLIVTGADGTILKLAADSPAAAPMPLAAFGGSLGQASATIPATGQGFAIVVSDAQDVVLSARLSDGLVRTLAAIPGVSGVATGPRDTWAVATVLGEGRLLRVATTGTQTFATGLLPTGHVTRTPDGLSLLIAHPGAARLSAYSTADGSVVVHAVDGIGIDGTLVEVHGLDDARLLILTDTSLWIADGLADLRPRPRLVPPSAPMFTGAWEILQYDLSGTGLSDDDVSFVVEDDPDAAFISHSAFAGPPGARKVPMLVAGLNLGSFHVSMRETATGAVLDTAPFEVTDHWTDPNNGPPRMFAGDSSARPAGDWGGGPDRPQNLGTKAHSGRWRLGVLLVNTSDGAFPSAGADLDAARKAVLDEVRDGVSFNGKTRSARHYYEELSGWDAASNRGLTIEVHGNQVYGPVDLPQDWGRTSRRRPTTQASSSTITGPRGTQPSRRSCPAH